MAKLNGVKTLDMVAGEITKVEYGGEVYAKVDGPAEKGDLVEVIAPWSTVQLGEKYIVTDTYSRSCHDYVRVDERICGYQRDFKVFRKASATPTTEQRVTDLEKRVGKLEGAEPEYVKIAKSEARVGDFVKYDGDEPISDLTVGKYYKINEIDSSDDPHITDDEGDDYDTAYDDFEVYRKVGAKADEPAPLKVGDYAKVVKDNHEHKVGDIIELIPTVSPIASCFDFRIKNAVTGRTGFISAKHLVRATDEEVAAAKEEAKWAKIGRKPGEFKEGDIAEVLCQVHADIPIGTIGTITKVDDDETVRVGANGVTIGNWHHLSEVKLITPVEARFDRA